jgi:hypothetical protein
LTALAIAAANRSEADLIALLPPEPVAKLALRRITAQAVLQLELTA